MQLPPLFTLLTPSYFRSMKGMWSQWDDVSMTKYKPIIVEEAPGIGKIYFLIYLLNHFKGSDVRIAFCTAKHQDEIIHLCYLDG